MLKKISLFAVLLFAAAVSAAVEVRQSTQIETMETFFLALIERDIDTMLKILPPGSIKAMQNTCGGEKQLREYLKLYQENTLPAAELAKIKAALENPEKKAAFLQNLVNMLGKGFVQIDGKWYVELTNFVPAAQIDQSTKAGAMEAYFRAMAEKNADYFWLLLPPADRVGIINAAGSEDKAKKFILELFVANLTDEEILLFKNIFSSEAGKKQFIQAAVAQMEKSLIQIDGKWYLNLNSADK